MLCNRLLVLLHVAGLSQQLSGATSTPTNALCTFHPCILHLHGWCLSPLIPLAHLYTKGIWAKIMLNICDNTLKLNTFFWYYSALFWHAHCTCMVDICQFWFLWHIEHKRDYFKPNLCKMILILRCTFLACTCTADICPRQFCTSNTNGTTLSKIHIIHKILILFCTFWHVMNFATKCDNVFISDLSNGGIWLG